MSITLGIVLLGLIVVAWGYSMYVSWKMDQGAPLAMVAADPIIGWWAQVARLTRRGWYAAGLKTRHLFTWGNARIGGAFVKVFPSAAPVFTKRDALTGLTHGPTSYFLKSLSPTRKAGNRRLPRTKKMI